MERAALVVTAAVLFSSAVYAHEPDTRTLPGIESIFSGLVQEEDVTLAFRYLREALDAAFAGREPPPPDALRQRAETIGEELKRRGASYGHSVLEAIEAIMRERIKDAPSLPPPSAPQSIGIRT